MKDLFIDLETRSGVDIGSCGSYRYAQDDDFEILLFAYAYAGEDVKVIDLKCGELIPAEIINDLNNPAVTKHAFNAAFEWWCLNQAGYKTPIGQWKCTMIDALYHGYPGSLESVGQAMELSQDKKKMTAGKALIRYFCVPCKPTKSNGGRTWNDPHHDPEKWELFKEYNRRDVEAEMEIERILLKYTPVPNKEWVMWGIDVLMNANGIQVDTDLIEKAIIFDKVSKSELVERAAELTGLDNPNSVAQLKQWISDIGGVPCTTLNKDAVDTIIKDAEHYHPDVVEMMKIRKMLGKTSVKKFDAMARSVGPDGRVRGTLQFYGAGRTGRWAGRIVQVQNLARNSLETLDEARNLVKSGRYEELKLIYGNVPDTLSQLVRTAFIPAEGHKFIVSDFSAIEARVIAWLAGEEWRKEVFANGGDIYCASASQMFHVPVEKHGVNGHLRQKGKIAELALGYQGGVGAMKSMDSSGSIPEDELPGIVRDWRAASPRIVKMWYALEEAAVECIRTGEDMKPYMGAGSYPPATDLVFRMDSGAMTIELPSGRLLYYQKPELKDNRFGRKEITFLGVDQQTKKVTRLGSYGGKLVENVVQAIARDCLAETILRCVQDGYAPVMHIHDEIVIEATMDQHLDDVNDIFARPIPWADGLLLNGAGFEGQYYMKD